MEIKHINKFHIRGKMTIGEFMKYLKNNYDQDSEMSFYSQNGLIGVDNVSIVIYKKNKCSF